MDRDVLHAERALAPDTGPVADLHRVDRPAAAVLADAPVGVGVRARAGVGVGVRRVCRLHRGHRLTHADLPCWSTGSLVGATVW